MSNTHVKNIKLGACKVSFGGVDLGYTKGGVQVEVATETLKVTVDQLGQTTISELVALTSPLLKTIRLNMRRSTMVQRLSRRIRRYWTRLTPSRLICKSLKGLISQARATCQ